MMVGSCFVFGVGGVDIFEDVVWESRDGCLNLVERETVSVDFPSHFLF